MIFPVLIVIMDRITYTKINSVFKRDKKNRFMNEFDDESFGYLFDNEWYGTEKIDEELWANRSKWSRRASSRRSGRHKQRD